MSRNQFQIIGLALLLSSALTIASVEAKDSKEEQTDLGKSEIESPEKPVRELKPMEGHLDSLPPVRDQLRAGVSFSKDILTGSASDSENKWYWIPLWFGGVRTCDKRITSSLQDLRNGTIESSPTISEFHSQTFAGFQADKNGDIWEYCRPPYYVEIDRGDSILINYISSAEPVSINATAVKLRFIYTSIIVDKSSDQITNTVQNESINIYTKSNDNQIMMVSSDKSFNQDGEPLTLATRRAVYFMSPFRPTDIYNGKNMKSLFRQFLAANGYQNKLPTIPKDSTLQKKASSADKAQQKKSKATNESKTQKKM